MLRIVVEAQRRRVSRRRVPGEEQREGHEENEEKSETRRLEADQ